MIYYVLVGIITTLSKDNYTGMKNYYYHSKDNNNSICEIKNLDHYLNENNPYIALYKIKI